VSVYNFVLDTSDKSGAPFGVLYQTAHRLLPVCTVPYRAGRLSFCFGVPGLLCPYVTTPSLGGRVPCPPRAPVAFAPPHPDVRLAGLVDFRIAGHPDFWIAGFLAFWIARHPALCT
jgi:hypothetical protein